MACCVIMSTVGLDPTKGYTIKDLWTKETTGTAYEREISRNVPAHGVVVLRIKGVSLPYNLFQYKGKK